MTGADLRRPTIEDVARVAEVSRSTAARAVAGYGHVAPHTRERVLTAAQRLGYRIHPLAQALARGLGHRVVVAVIGPDVSVLDDPFIGRVTSSVARVCDPVGVGVALRWLPLRPPSALTALADDRSLRGLMLLNPTTGVLSALPDRLRSRTCSIGVGAPGVASFDVDNTAGVDTILRHLHCRGRRNVAMVAGPAWLPCTSGPVRAYRQRTEAAGLPERVIRGGFGVPDGCRAGDYLLRQWPDTDAVLACCDATALGVLARLREHGIAVPDDVAVTGFDDIPFAGLSTPALTTSTNPIHQIVEDAARALLYPSVQNPGPRMYPSRLVVRQTS
jgi:DNA-binding LacI/PurR family transcriptional regulator